MISFESEGLSCSLDIINLQFLIKIKMYNKFSALFFFVIKTLDPDPDLLEMLDLINPDP
jgi:hypothetical protein